MCVSVNVLILRNITPMIHVYCSIFILEAGNSQLRNILEVELVKQINLFKTLKTSEDKKEFNNRFELEILGATVAYIQTTQ